MQFEIDDPRVIVEGRMTHDKFLVRFPSQQLRRVGDSLYRYYVAECSCLGGLTCMIGFHFPRHTLAKLEFYRKSYPQPFDAYVEYLQESYREFQYHFERAFGKPTCQAELNGFPDCAWKFDAADIVHQVTQRFTLEEHMEIHFRES